MNTVDDTLATEGADLSGREQLTSVHGNRFVLFYVFRRIGVARLNSDEEVSLLTGEAEILTRDCLKQLNGLISQRFPDAYPGNIFKNQERQNELLEALPG